MTRNWIATASRAFGIVRLGSVHPRRRRANPGLENLEQRLSLSNWGVGQGVRLELNPLPLPPGYMAIKSNVEIVGNHIGYEMIQGNHIGYEMIQGNHIGYEMIQGNHIGTNVVQGQHIGTAMIQGNHIGMEM
jgi:hypothetical protein